LEQSQNECHKLISKVRALQVQHEETHNKLLKEQRRFMDLELVVAQTRNMHIQSTIDSKSKDEHIDFLKAELQESDISHESRLNSDEVSKDPKENRSQSLYSGKQRMGSSSEGSDYVESELEAMINDQEEVIRNLSIDRHVFEKVVSTADQSESST